jgi:hypothetical protein
VVFHDSIERAAEAALYHTQRLPEALQKKGLIMHYHGGMSKEYLTLVYEDFSDQMVTVEYFTQLRVLQWYVYVVASEYLH